MSSSAFFHKPELALRRALELQGINQEVAALELLHEVLSSRRHRTWSPAYEQIMIAYLNLCLKLHKAREAKDGLHQYRNLAQSQAPGSLEKVIRYLVERAEEQCTKAKAAATALSESQPSTLESSLDEDGIAPQAVLLSSMSTDPAKNQRDSTLVLPSLKFLWEIYRAVLDILRSNSKLEHVYHSAAVGALRFCREYQRRTEFRRLCDLLRMHLGNLQKYGDDSSGKNNKVRGWEGWSNEAIELHLQTRFAQLETASVLHLYTEGFRTVEDIYNILQISHQRRKQNPELPPPKAKLMAKYYEQLTTLFWVSENYLFHAFAWFKYYALCKEFNKGMGEEVKAQQASAVLLAALCIPSLPKSGDSSSSGRGGNNRFDDSVMQEKMARMATLLGFHTRNPTRENLLEEISSRGIFEQVPEYLKQLFYLLEHDSDPLVLIETATPLLDKLSTDTGSADDAVASSLAQYVKPLRSVLLLKLLWNLSSAYHTVRIDFLKGITDGLGMSFENVEKEIVLFTQTHKGLIVRIDHRSECLRFGDAQLESDSMRSQLTVLAQQLDKVCQTLAPTEAKPVDQSQLYQSIRENREADHTRMLERKNWIEQRKEEMERLAQEKVRLEQETLAKEEAARKAEEELRIQREQRLREQEKQKKIQREMENMKKEQLLKAMGHNTEVLTAEEMAKMDADKLAKEHQEKQNKKKEEAERKIREEAKRLDYLVRAIRIEELPLVKAKYEEKVKKDRKQYEQEVVEKTQRAKLQWESDKKDKERLSSHCVFDFMGDFEGKVMSGRAIKHKELCDEADQEAEVQAEKAKIQRARKRKQDEAKRLAEEEAKLKQEEEARKADEERRKKEEARREKEAKEEERRQAEAARMAQERERQGKQRDDRGPRSSRALDNASGSGGRYVPPTQRGQTGGGDSGGSRFGGGGYPGGGRYEGRSGGDRRGGYGDRRGGFGDRDRGGGSYGDRRGGQGDRDRGGGYGDRRGGYGDRDRGDTGGGWRR
ncbi:MAG: hypothetical protein SGBAC_000295 [Bacillariaceae sp.]